MTLNVAINCDCMEHMASVPDNYFDLCIADPPYGDTMDGDAWRVDHLRDNARKAEKQRVAEQDAHVVNKLIEWDTRPTQKYFDEIFRVSKNQVIWGGNYFALPPCRCFLVWRKTRISENFSMAMAEYAWTSFNDNAKVFEAVPQNPKHDPRWHPTGKPIALYEWTYKLFCHAGDKVFDPYLGSGSSRIAALNLGLDFVGCEINPSYYEKQQERYEKYAAQVNLFLGESH